MNEYGCLAHFDHFLFDDIGFAKKNGFSFLQIWYDKNGISLKKESDPLESLLKIEFPTVIHAVLDINDFDEHVPKLKTIMDKLGHKEIIIHPVCKTEIIENETIEKLNGKIKFALEVLSNKKIFLESNSKIDPIFNTVEDIKYIFVNNPNLEFILDIAHIDNLVHLTEMISIKKPGYFHLADKRLNVIHEHLPVGEGNIDFDKIFSEIIIWNGLKIIFEIVQGENELVKSKTIIEKIIKNN